MFVINNNNDYNFSRDIVITVADINIIITILNFLKFFNAHGTVHR
jgi:hypothetical protein